MSEEKDAPLEVRNCWYIPGSNEELRYGPVRPSENAIRVKVTIQRAEPQVHVTATGFVVGIGPLSSLTLKRKSNDADDRDIFTVTSVINPSLAAEAMAFNRQVEVFQVDDGPQSVRFTDGGLTLLQLIEVYNWRCSDRVGCSSSIIAHVLAGTPMLGTYTGPPEDSSDFVSCQYLVELFSWESRLPEVVQRFPSWKGVVENWAQLKAAPSKNERWQLLKTLRPK